MALSGTQLAYKYARAGVARAGASRVNYFLPIRGHYTIGGTVRLVEGDCVITQTWKTAYPTATMTVIGSAPTVGGAVKIGLGDAATNLLFGGRVRSVGTRIGKRSFERVRYAIRADGYARDMDKRLVLKRYHNETFTSSVNVTGVTPIVLDLMSTYASGITTNHVQTGLADIDSIEFNYETLSSCLTRLAARIGALWYVDAFGDLHFGTSDPWVSAPETVSTSSAFEWRNLEHTKDIGEVATRAIVEGRGGRLDDSQSISLADTNLYVEFPENLFADPADYAEDLYVRVKTEVLDYDLLSSGVSGFLNVPSGSIAGALGDQRYAVGDPINQIVTINATAAQTALAALEGGDGIRERHISDSGLDYDGMRLRGHVELAATSDPIERVTYDTRDVNVRPGASVTLSVGGLSGTYQIQQVTTTIRADEHNVFPWRSVTAYKLSTYPDLAVTQMAPAESKFWGIVDWMYFTTRRNRRS